VTDAVPVLALLSVALPVAGGLLVQAARTTRLADLLFRATAAATSTAALLLAGVALARPDESWGGTAYLVDAAGAVFVAVIAVVGLLSALVSPTYLAGREESFFGRTRPRRWYYLAFALFWAALLAVPLAGNLGLAWLVVEATTAASALLVAFSGKRSALEAGWKYLVLTSIGLTVALLGIVVLFVAEGGRELGSLDWGALQAAAPALSHDAALAAFVLLLAGLAAKIGWAPVHNWLPDAHSEAPPPVSALLSAALLPAVVLVAWRTKTALGPSLGGGTAGGLFLAFGLASLAVAVPFLWRPLAWKRLLAYSSLEHMGVLALGIGFGTSLALAGVVLHVAGHALAKSLGFYAATPLFRAQRSADRRPARGVARTNPALAGAMGVSLGSLAGLPPSPLFFSEVFILLGGIAAGEIAVAALAAVLLALGFLGLAHALIESLLGRARARRVGGRARREVLALGLAVGLALVGLSATAWTLPGSGLVDAIARWAA
jgi:hydrogenase-4 component F